MSKKKGPLRRLIGGFWRAVTWLRVTVMNLLFLLVLALVLGVLLAERPPLAPIEGALILNPSGQLVDEYSYIDPFMEWLDGGNQLPTETLLQDLIDAVDRAADDPRIELLVLHLDHLNHAGLSKLQELAAALERFRASGKPIIATGDNYTQDQYWLAAHADEVILNPMGAVLLRGYGVYRNYYAEALEKLEINFHLFRVGEYKSAMEPFVRNDMSAEDAAANRSWLEELWSQYRDAVVAQRGIGSDNFSRYVNEVDQVMAQVAGDASAAALDWKLVDAVKSREDVNLYLADKVGADAEGRFRGIDFRRYLQRTDRELVGPSAAQVGVIVASGLIVDGEEESGTIGGDTLARTIHRAERDESIKAVVLRIDSGGGSAFASEVIRRRLLALKHSGKPLVVSMGSVAASGGYWIAAPADEIWATPATLTGSIGIFGAFPTLEQTLANIGIHNDGVGTTTVADAFRIERPMNPVVAAALQRNIEHGYQRFLAVVAEGRGMNPAQVAAIAEGRVWAGVAALDNGLVDKLGGLEDAVSAAAQLAGLEQYDIERVTPPLSPAQQLLREFFALVPPPAGLAASWRQWLRPVLDDWSLLLKQTDPRGIYLYCTSCPPL